MSSATFEANPNSDNEPWIERPAIEGGKFRIWHLMFFCLCTFGVLVVLICCCVKIRIPRTKQEIEADYKRKKIAIKFRKRLKIINNQDMQAVDLRKALEIIIEADYKKDHQEPMTDPQVTTTEKEKLVQPTNRSSFGEKMTNVKIGDGTFKKNIMDRKKIKVDDEKKRTLINKHGGADVFPCS